MDQENFIKTLIENKETLKKSGSLHLQDYEILAAFDADGNMIAVGEAWAYLSESGMLMSAFSADGSPRQDSCSEKQRIEMLYLLPGYLWHEEYTIPAKENYALPLPLDYQVNQITCRDHVFTISSKAGNPPVCGSYNVIGQQLRSAAHSYYTRELASNVLERYYYEFLPESHQLYLEEEQFRREREERKKRKKDLKISQKKITEKDFQKDADGAYSCEQKIRIWGVTTTLYASFRENPEYREWTLEKYISQLSAHIQWIDGHEKEIEQEMLNKKMVELANYWMEGQEVTDEEGQTYYELDDGNSFPYPITEAVFLESLYVQSVRIENSTPQKARISFFFGTEPDFFAFHSIEVIIYADTDTHKTGCPDTQYTIHVKGLAG